MHPSKQDVLEVFRQDMHSHAILFIIPTTIMDISNIADLAPDLSNIEIAFLLSLVAQEHCLIETTEDAIHDVAKELALVIAVLDKTASSNMP